MDIVLHCGKDIIPIELKYCTKCLPIEETEGIILKNQGAELIRRYDYIKDISRIESMRKAVGEKYNFVCGYAVFLTNSSHYWEESEGWENHFDRDFRFHAGKGTIGGKMSWTEGTGGTTKGREKPLVTETYEVRWRDYISNPKFRYISIKIDPLD